jgi:hypothetical protein
MNTNDVLQAAGKSAPPIAYVSVTLLHISLPDWVAILTIGYILLQGAHLVWRWHRQARRNSGSGE